MLNPKLWLQHFILQVLKFCIMFTEWRCCASKCEHNIAADQTWSTIIQTQDVGSECRIQLNRKGMILIKLTTTTKWHKKYVKLFSSELFITLLFILRTKFLICNAPSLHRQENMRLARKSVQCYLLNTSGMWHNATMLKEGKAHFMHQQTAVISCGTHWHTVMCNWKQW